MRLTLTILLPILTLNICSFLNVNAETSNLFTETLLALNDDNAGTRVAAIQRITGWRCSVLMENEGEILKRILDMNLHPIFTEIYERQCKLEHDLFRTFVNTIISRKDAAEMHSLLQYVGQSQEHRRFIFSKCAAGRFYEGVLLFESEICRIVNAERQNVLHFAAGLSDDVLFDLADRCKMLINQKDYHGKYPLDHASSPEIAARLNSKWLEVARHRYLNLDSSQRRLAMCTKYELLEQEEEVKRGKTLQEAFIEGISDVKGFFCPYLKMQINIFEYKNDSLPGPLLEWFSFLLSDIFWQGKQDGSVESFSLPLFEYSDDQKCFVPNGLYGKEVYEFAGKIVKIANHFGFGLSYNVAIKAHEDGLSEAFEQGKESINLIRAEAHKDQFYKNRFYIKTGSETIPVNVSNTIFHNTMGSDAFKLIRAFSSLTDLQQLRIIELIRGKPKLIMLYFRIGIFEPKEVGFEFVKRNNELIISSASTIANFKEALETGIKAYENK